MIPVPPLIAQRVNINTLISSKEQSNITSFRMFRSNGTRLSMCWSWGGLEVTWMNRLLRNFSSDRWHFGSSSAARHWMAEDQMRLQRMLQTFLPLIRRPEIKVNENGSNKNWIRELPGDVIFTSASQIDSFSITTIPVTLTQVLLNSYNKLY